MVSARLTLSWRCFIHPALAMFCVTDRLQHWSAGQAHVVIMCVMKVVAPALCCLSHGSGLRSCSSAMCILTASTCWWPAPFIASLTALCIQWLQLSSALGSAVTQPCQAGLLSPHNTKQQACTTHVNACLSACSLLLRVLHSVSALTLFVSAVLSCLFAYLGTATVRTAKHTRTCQSHFHPVVQLRLLYCVLQLTLELASALGQAGQARLLPPLLLLQRLLGGSAEYCTVLADAAAQALGPDNPTSKLVKVTSQPCVCLALRCARAARPVVAVIVCEWCGEHWLAVAAEDAWCRDTPSLQTRERRFTNSNKCTAAAAAACAAVVWLHCRWCCMGLPPKHSGAAPHPTGSRPDTVAGRAIEHMYT
jgi:hypothetical protein